MTLKGCIHVFQVVPVLFLHLVLQYIFIKKLNNSMNMNKNEAFFACLLARQCIRREVLF